MIPAIDGGDTLSLVLRIGIEHAEQPASRRRPSVFAPNSAATRVTLDSSPNRNIVIATMTDSQLLVPIHVARQVDVFAETQGRRRHGRDDRGGRARLHPIAPAGGSTPVTNGVFIQATIALGPPPPP